MIRKWSCDIEQKTCEYTTLVHVYIRIPLFNLDIFLIKKTCFLSTIIAQ